MRLCVLTVKAALRAVQVALSSRLVTGHTLACMQAEQREKAGDLAAAAAFLHKCLEAAEHCADAAAAGAASHRLGLLCAAQGRWHEAADHQAVYVQRSKQVGVVRARGSARAVCVQPLLLIT